MDAVDRQIERLADYFRGETGKENYGNLLRYAQARAARYYWYSSNSSSLPKGFAAEELVGEVIQQVLNTDPSAPDRRVIPEDVEIEAALKMHLCSKLSALACSWENRTFSREADLPRPRGVDQEITSPLESGKPIWESSDAEAAPEDREEALKKADQLMEYVRGDKLVHSMLVLIRDEGLDKPVETIARRLDVAVKDIYIARKRLKTAVQRFLKMEGKTA